MSTQWEEEIIVDIHNMDIDDKQASLDGFKVEMRDFDVDELERLIENLGKIRKAAQSILRSKKR